MDSDKNFFKSILQQLRIIFALLLVLFLPGLAIAQPSLQPSEIPLNNFSLDQLQQAAEAGDPDAQYALGYMYYYGKNVPQNKQVALNWIKRAAVQGQTQAISALSLLGESLQPAPTPQPDATPASPAPAPSAPKGNAPASSNKTVSQTNNVSSDATNVSDATTATTNAPAGSYYTIQLTASSNKSVVNKYTTTYHLQGKATVSQTKRNGKNWYVLTYGRYPTREKAQAAIATLPSAVRAQKPWVKLVGKTKSKK